MTSHKTLFKRLDRAAIFQYLAAKFVKFLVKFILLTGSIWICLGGLLFLTEVLAAPSTLPPLPKLNLDSSITVSGLSSGGYMANQFHLAHAEKLMVLEYLLRAPIFVPKAHYVLHKTNAWTKLIVSHQ